jgi:hypothetical protein
MIEENFKIEKKEKADYPPLPEDVYQAELIDVTIEEKDTTNNKTKEVTKEKFFKFEYGLLDGVENGKSLRGRRVWMNYIPVYLYIGAKGKNKLYKAVEVLTKRELTREEEATFEAKKLNELIGMQCRVVVKNTVKDGKTYSNIDSYLYANNNLLALTENEKKPKDNAELETPLMQSQIEDDTINVETIPFG